MGFDMIWRLMVHLTHWHFRNVVVILKYITVYVNMQLNKMTTILPNNIFNYILLNENVLSFIRISFMFVTKGPIEVSHH